MAAAEQGHAASQPTHYEVLNVTSDLITSQKDPAVFVKRAYHRALLKNHPDKAGSSTRPLLSVDQITKAWEVLSSPRQRAEYDTQLRLTRRGNGEEDSGEEPFHTGVENVDLDDLEYDERESSWSRSCRCGNDKGYAFTEGDLLEAGDDGLLMVGCQDCSLWLRVHFAVLEDEEHDNLNKNT